MSKLSRVELLGSQDLMGYSKISRVSSSKNSRARCFRQGDPHKLYITRKVMKCRLDKIISFFAIKEAEAVNAKMIDWYSGELIGYQMRSLI